MFREIAFPFYMAVTLLEHGEWLIRRGRADDSEPVLAEVRAVFDGLRASPWIERADRVRAGSLHS